MVNISDLPESEFTDDKIDNCIYVDFSSNPETKNVRMQVVFNWIKKQAIDGGLTVKMEGEKIMFITK